MNTTYGKHIEETGGRNAKDNTKRMQGEKDLNRHLMRKSRELRST